MHSSFITLQDLGDEDRELSYPAIAYCPDEHTVIPAVLVGRREGGFAAALPAGAPGFDEAPSHVVTVLAYSLLIDDEAPLAQVAVRLVDLPDEAMQFFVEADGDSYLQDADDRQVGFGPDLAAPSGTALLAAFDLWVAAGAEGPDGTGDRGRGRGAGSRGRAGGRGRGAAGAAASGGASAAAAATAKAKAAAAGKGPRVTVASLHELLTSELGGIRDRLTHLEGAGRGQPLGGAGLRDPAPPPGIAQPCGGGRGAPLLGGGPPGIDPFAAAAAARGLLSHGVDGRAGAPQLSADALRAPLGFGALAGASPYAGTFHDARASGSGGAPVLASAWGGSAAPVAAGTPTAAAAAARQHAPGVGAASRELQQDFTFTGGGAGGDSAGTDPTAHALMALAAAITGQRKPLDDIYPDVTVPAGSEGEYNALWSASGQKQSGYIAIQRIRATRETQPSIVIVSHERTAREAMGVLPGESWSWGRHCKEHLLPHIRTFRTLRRLAVAVAAGLDEGRVGGTERMAAYFHHLYRVIETAAKDPGHELTWGFPILGVHDPDAPRPAAGWSTGETAALAAYHREEHAMELARASLQKASSSSGSGGAQHGDGGDAGQQQTQQQQQRQQAPKPKPQPGRGKGGGRGKGNSAPGGAPPE